MTMIVANPYVQDEIIAQRQAAGRDRQDEVWEGVYVIMPDPNNEHQDLIGGLTSIFWLTIKMSGLGRVFPGCNVSNQPNDWIQNYRCPDVAVYLKGTSAEDRGTHWYGGPDLAVEIISPQDRSREKLAFYAAVNTHELLLIDREPWALELYRQSGGQMKLTGRSDLENAAVITSEAVPLSWRLIPGEERPRIALAHDDGKQKWTI